MRKRILFSILIVFLILNISFIIAQEDTDTVDEKAYACLEERVENKCLN